MRDVSRKTKNQILAGVAVLYFGLLTFRLLAIPEAFSARDGLWMIGAVVVALIYLKPFVELVPRIYRHAALFLLVGAAVGLTLGEALKAPADLFWGFWIWLVLAAIAAAVHYSPSRKDIYR